MIHDTYECMTRFTSTFYHSLCLCLSAVSVINKVPVVLTANSFTYRLYCETDIWSGMPCRTPHRSLIPTDPRKCLIIFYFYYNIKYHTQIVLIDNYQSYPYNPFLCRGPTAQFFRVGRLFCTDFLKIGQCEHKNR